MPNPVVFPGSEAPSHDVKLTNATTGQSVGLIYQREVGKDEIPRPLPLQIIPISDPARNFTIQKREWTGGRGKVLHQDDPTGFFDAHGMWTMSQKLMPSMMAKFATGHRTAEVSAPGNAPLLQFPTNTLKYYARSFTASASSNRSVIWLWLYFRGRPNSLTVAIYSDSAGSPNSALQSATLAYTSANRYGATPVAITAQALVSGTTYWVVISTSANTDDNHWAVAVDPTASSATRKTSLNGSSWTTANSGMYYRVTDANTARQWRMFTFFGADYFFSQNDAGTAGSLYVNGDRGKATGGASTTITDTKSGTYADAGWTTDMWAGAKIRIIAGTGAVTTPRTVASNTTTVITVSSAWDITPDSTSEYVIYDTGVMSPVATTGITALT